MAGDDDLDTPARFLEDVGEHAGGGGMKRGFRFFDAHQPGASGSAGALKQGGQHTERPQRPVRYVVREKTPGIGIAPHLLSELQRQLGAYGPGFDAADSRRYLGQVVSDALHVGRRLRLHAVEDTGDVASVPVEQIAGVGRLELADLRRVQVVESHSRQGVVHRTEHLVRGCRQQVEPVASAGRKRGRHRAASVSAVLYAEETRSLGVRRSNDAVLPPDPVPTLGPSPDFEGVPAGRLRHAEVDPDGEVVGVAARAPPHFVDPAAFAQGVFGGETQGLRDEAERIEEVALAGAVRSDEKRERRQRDVASGDALVVAQGDARDRDGTGCVQRFAAFERWMSSIPFTAGDA